MRPTRISSHSLRPLGAAFLLTAFACGGSEAPPTTGSLRVSAATAGADVDPDGYSVAVVVLQGDSSSAILGTTTARLAVNGSVTFADLKPGPYSVELGGAAANCPIVGQNPRAVTIHAGGTAEITFQVSCLQRIDLTGVWNYTAQFGSPLQCNDTGSVVLTGNGDTLTGTNDQVGTCDLQSGSIDHSRSDPVIATAVYAAAGAVSISLSRLSCSYSASVAGTPPDRLIDGSVSCPSGNGTWAAVRGGGSIASLTVTPPTLSVVAGGTVQLRALMIDASGSRRIGPPVTWTSDAPGAATVDASGIVTGAAAGSATITASAETKSGTATATVEVVKFAAVQAGAFHSCGLTAGGAYCWGNNTYGQIGNGAKANGLAPVAVSDGASLVAISTGAVHTCGLTATGAAYCWGLDYYGELGAGATGAQLCGSEASACSTTPLAVAGGHTFSSLSAGWEQTCARASDGSAYCWGDNSYGQLGNGSAASTRTPVQVAGALSFTSIGAGVIFACGLTTGGAAYCWGNNTAGQLGIGPTSPVTCNAEPCSTTPVAVSGGLTFTALSVGYWHACGLTSSGAAYCWGDNDGGQLGSVTTETCTGLGASVDCSRSPVPVATNLTFTQLPAGSFHSCGLTSGGDAYCWGDNVYGQLGNATTISSPFPAPVAGGLTFAAASAYGRWHTCGLSLGGIVYCWGLNAWGQLGDGVTLDEDQPAQVLGQGAVSGTAALRAARVRRGVVPATQRSPSLRPPAP
jgi:alpha-tubulin suppressor-like RCC1 family protein